MNNQLEFILKSPVSYAHKGDTALGYKILAKAPTARVRNQLINIKQTFFQALTNIRKSSSDQQSDSAEQSADKMDGKQVMMMLYFGGIDMVKLQETVRDMFISGQLLNIEGDTNMPSHLVDQIELNDFESLMGEYLASFLVPSLLGM